MSAAIAWDVTAAPAPVPARPSRPQLVSVPCGDDLHPRTARPVRLTRAGRLTLTMLALAAVVGIAVALLSPGSAGAAGVEVDHSTTVQPGQTLSGIAAAQLPQLPVADAVARIQVANDLTSSDVHAGQALLIPVVR